jgi:hypothetical protein
MEIWKWKRTSVDLRSAVATNAVAEPRRDAVPTRDAGLIRDADPTRTDVSSVVANE